MPVNLVLVRHGEGEHNLASRQSKRGDNSFADDPRYKQRHGSRHRLTAKGRWQAEQTAAWLNNNGLYQFDRRIVSTYTRAMETASGLCTVGPDWNLEQMLREREWGDLESMSWDERREVAEKSMAIRDTDPFYWIPPNGESMADLTIRLRSVLDTLHRECSDMNVIIVCHGEVMRGFRYLLERMSIERWMELETSDKPGDKIFNCQVLHYTRRNPVTNKLAKHLDWMRSVCPNQPSNNGPGWEPIIRQRFSDGELAAIVADTPALFPDVIEDNG